MFSQYLWGIREGQKSRKVQDLIFGTPYVSSVIDNNLRTSWGETVKSSLHPTKWNFHSRIFKNVK